MYKNDFCNLDEIRTLLESDIVPAYQAAFSGEPWNEVSKCPDPQQQCVGGLSRIAVGACCDACDLSPTQPAYEAEELIERFESLEANRMTQWYIERNKGWRVTLAALSWRATPELIAQEKYGDVPEMGPVLAALLPSRVAWIDEVFANKALKSSGNLQNFDQMITGLTALVGARTAVFRTINPAMIRAAQRDFGKYVSVLRAGIGQPDRRDLVIIDITRGEK